jgi:hypothetical protein
MFAASGVSSHPRDHAHGASLGFLGSDAFPLRSSAPSISLFASSACSGRCPSPNPPHTAQCAVRGSLEHIVNSRASAPERARYAPAFPLAAALRGPTGVGDGDADLRPLCPTTVGTSRAREQVGVLTPRGGAPRADRDYPWRGGTDRRRRRRRSPRRPGRAEPRHPGADGARAAQRPPPDRAASLASSRLRPARPRTRSRVRRRAEARRRPFRDAHLPWRS